MIIEKIFNAPRTKRDNLGPRIIPVPLIKSGIRVDQDTALKYSAVFACVRVIAETIASLSWHVYLRKQDGSKQRMATSNAEMLLNRRPNPEMTPFAFKETLTAWALTWGNGYAEIERDMANRPAALWPIAPDRVEVQRDSNGRLVYEISNARGANNYLYAEDIYHLKGLGFDGITGYSVISYAARSIGLGIAAEEFGSSFFGNGAHLGSVLQIPAGSGLSAEAKKNMRETFNRAHQGPHNAHKVEILDGGTEYKEIGVPPEDAQFLETRQHQVEEICRWFRVPPHKIQHLLRSTFNNIEHMSIEYVQDTLMPWANRLEQEANSKLFGKGNNLYTKINMNTLLRGDSAARSTFYREMWNLGVFSVNEIREMEDMNPVESGDKRFVQLNMTTLEKAGEEPEPPEPQEEPKINAYRKVISADIRRLLNVEINAANGAKNRYSREEFAEWIDSGGYWSVLDEIRTSIEVHIRTLLNAMKIHADIDDTVNAYIKSHQEASRQMLFLVYDGKKVDTEQRADRIVDGLIESIYKYAKLKYATANA